MISPEFVVIDVETACQRTSSICQIGIVGYAGGVEVLAYETLVDPCDAFSPFNIGIHGITAEHVLGKPTFTMLHPELAAHLGGRVTVAHSGFDKGALGRACDRDGLPPIAARWLDSVTIARRAWPELANHKLGTLAAFLELEHRHHDALSDARAAGQVVLRAMAATGMTLADWLTPTPARAGRRAGRG
ncbi:3'-5' exonuclease [Sphingomonadaceae bacterium jetA1]|jgi:DNA polymerase-3 subunit epsilon|uniref:3'-5' exonuclease n=1 Tax=Facivitalis istanbulensis TaxID=3075838 RepID=UPI0034981E12